MRYLYSAVKLPKGSKHVTVVIQHQINDPRLLIPDDLAAIVTEIIVELLAAFGYRTAHTTDPSSPHQTLADALSFLCSGILRTTRGSGTTQASDLITS